MAGHRPGQIAKILGIQPSRVSQILNDPRAEHDRRELAKVVAERVTDVHLKLRLHAAEAVDVLVDTIRSQDEKVAQKGAIALLDRAGYSKYQGEHVPKQILSPAAADAILSTMREVQQAPSTPMYEMQEAELVESIEEDEDDDS